MQEVQGQPFQTETAIHKLTSRRNSADFPSSSSCPFNPHAKGKATQPFSHGTCSLSPPFSDVVHHLSGASKHAHAYTHPRIPARNARYAVMLCMQEREKMRRWKEGKEERRKGPTQRGEITEETQAMCSAGPAWGRSNLGGHKRRRERRPRPATKKGEEGEKMKKNKKK